MSSQARGRRTAPAAQPRHLYVTAWQPRAAAPSGQANALLLLCNDAMQEATAVANGDAASRQTPAFSAVVVSVAALRHSQGLRALLAIEAAFVVAQLYGSTSRASVAPVWLVTRGQSAHGAREPMQVGAWGMARTVRVEVPLPLCCVETSLSAVAARESRFDEPEVALRASEHLAPRLQNARLDDVGGAARLHFHARGAISNLFLEPQPGASEVEVTDPSELLLQVHVQVEQQCCATDMPALRVGGWERPVLWDGHAQHVQAPGS